MNNYETVCVVRPDVSDDVVKAIIQKATATLESGKGTIARVDEWGRRRLAYPIQKKNEGFYFVLTFTSNAEVSKEINRQLRLNEDVLRYQTVRLEELQKAAEPAKEAEVKAEGGQA